MHSSAALSSPRLGGFTLIELSVVLIIIGLLTGGIIMGASLIDNARLKSVVVELQKYQAAATDFKKQYKALPGDMADAMEYWGQGLNCPGMVTPGTANGVCNGNGNQTFDTQTEAYQFWRELALSGRIAGNYTGNGTASVAGTNVPDSQMKLALWEVISPPANGDSISYQGDYGNALRIAGLGAGPIFKPEDADRLDRKLDDGNPSMGKVIAAEPVGWGKCSTSTNNAPSSSAAYNLGQADVTCSLYFVRLF